jgi:proteic killer suppression protein
LTLLTSAVTIERVIRSFRGKDAEAINDLRVPPGNRLEKLAGDRAGQYSVRVNDQWRICFTWSASGASDVEFVDYH